MKIDRFVLHNFKCFEDTCSINGLADALSDKKRIILFGGMNGAGKTTLFEAVLLCLYGQRNKTLWPSKGAKREDYQNYIFAVTNNQAKRTSLRPEMWIELSLSELGEITQALSLKRSWKIDAATGTIYDENLTIYDSDNNPFEFVSESNWEDFIEELIPYEISQFFFFDGEKIQDFVKDEDKAFAESLEKVLGISLYEKLRSDLEVVRRRILGDYQKDEDAKVKIAQLDAEIAESETNIQNAEEAINSLQEEIRKLEEDIEEIDIETRRITRIKAQTLEEYEAEKEKLDKAKAVHEQKIFEAIEDSLPFVITGGLCQGLREQLIHEQYLREWLAAQKALEPKIYLITQRLFAGETPVPPILPNQREFYEQKLVAILKEVFAEKPDEFENVVLLHDLAKNDSEQILFRIQNTHGVVEKLATHLSRLQEIEPKLKKISQTAQQAIDPEAAKLYEQRGKLHEQIEFKKQEIEHHRTEIDKQNAEIAAKRRQHTELEKKVVRTLEMQKQMEYCKRLRDTLETFSHKLRMQKVNQLQAYTHKMWQQLAHKKDQVKSIVINPDRQFSIDLYDGEEKLIDKTKLSAGEKELLAISLIWALSQLADRALPIIIDTPLGRLDTIHRTNIARNYFPNASHQVILLSTNTEIVGKEYEAIRPFVCKSYIIKKNKAVETSRISEGYFE
jgi:DNA sulfur modification protein DndD